MQQMNLIQQVYKLIQQVKGAEASRSSKTYVWTLHSKNYFYILGIVMARLNGDLEN